MKTLLFTLVTFVAVTSIISGLLLISNPDGSIFNMSLSLLDDTPFNNYVIPGIILTTVVGVVNMVAVFFNLTGHVNRYNWALAGGVMLSGWIVVQLILIHAFSWLQLLYFATGMLIILLAYQLKGKWAL